MFLLVSKFVLPPVSSGANRSGATESRSIERIDFEESMRVSVRWTDGRTCSVDWAPIEVVPARELLTRLVELRLESDCYADHLILIVDLSASRHLLGVAQADLSPPQEETLPAVQTTARAIGLVDMTAQCTDLGESAHLLLVPASGLRRGLMPQREIPTRQNIFQNPLTVRELDVLSGLAEGLTYKEIATSRGISVNTVASYIKKIYSKLQVNSRSQAIYQAVQTNLINLTVKPS